MIRSDRGTEFLNQGMTEFCEGNEETRETRPGRAGAAVSAAHKAVKVIAQRGHEPQRDVDIHCEPGVIGVDRGGAFGDVIQSLVHGEEERDDLLPLGEVCASRGDLEFDVVADVDGEYGVGEVGGKMCVEGDGGRDIGGCDDG